MELFFHKQGTSIFADYLSQVTPLAARISNIWCRRGIIITLLLWKSLVSLISDAIALTYLLPFNHCHFLCTISLVFLLTCLGGLEHFQSEMIIICGGLCEKLVVLKMCLLTSERSAMARKTEECWHCEDTKSRPFFFWGLTFPCIQANHTSHIFSF